MSSTTRPRYLDKHPCLTCGTGYGECSQGWMIGLQCCRGCDHPGHDAPDAWTPEDLAEMEGRR